MHCRKEVSMSRYSAQQSSISENNRSRILQYLYHNGICSRAQIAKAIKLTPAAITKITAKLLAQGIIEETGDMDGGKNRRSIGLKLNTTRFRVIGIKFARSLVQIGVFGLCGNALSIESTSDDVVTYTREILYTSASDENDAVLLKVVTDTGDVRCNFITVGKLYSCDLSHS